MIKNYYDFSNGVKITAKEIDEWHQAALQSLKDGRVSSIHRSGNSMVFGLRLDSGEIFIYEITNGYKQFHYEKTTRGDRDKEEPPPPEPILKSISKDA